MLNREKSSILDQRRISIVDVNTIAERIRSARIAAGFETQVELAKAMGISKSAVNQWEAGKNENLKLEHLVALADLCSVDIRWLATGEGPREGLSREDHDWLDVGRLAGPRERQAIREILGVRRERDTDDTPAAGAG